MRRQRVLERVGWRFWRCFASSFYRDTERVTNDLFEMLARLGIEPSLVTAMASGHHYTEHRIITPDASPTVSGTVEPAQSISLNGFDTRTVPGAGIEVGDRFVIVFGDDKRRMSLRLTETTHDPDNGLLARSSELGKAVRGAEEGDEIEIVQSDGRRLKAVVESITQASETRGPVNTPNLSSAA
jgi:hypothetical protein